MTQPSIAIALLSATLCACTEAPPPPVDPPPPATRGSAEHVDVEALKTLARSTPRAALAALNEAHPAGDYPPALQEIALLAHTTRFNEALKSLGEELDLRAAIANAITLAEAPLPENKRRLAQPIWRILGQLEAQLADEPEFCLAAGQRLQSNPIILQIVGPELVKRLGALTTEAEATIMRARTEHLIKSLSFDALVETLVEWSKRPDKVSPSALKVGLVRVLTSLESDQRGARAPQVRQHALMLSKQSALIGTLEGGAERVARIITKSGQDDMERLTRAVRASSGPMSQRMKLACEAFTYAKTEAEFAGVDKATSKLRAQLETQASGAARRYLKAIETRDFKRWQALETPFLEASSTSRGDFSRTRRAWLEAHPGLDPRRAPLKISDLNVNICKGSLSFALARGMQGSPAEVALTMCWHAQGRAWFPCRPLTNKPKGSEVKP